MEFKVMDVKGIDKIRKKIKEEMQSATINGIASGNGEYSYVVNNVCIEPFGEFFMCNLEIEIRFNNEYLGSVCCLTYGIDEENYNKNDFENYVKEAISKIKYSTMKIFEWMKENYPNVSLEEKVVLM